MHKTGTLAVVGLAVLCSAGCSDNGGSIATVSQQATVCASGPTVPGVDVSKWQGDVDWSKVRSSGVEFAFLRVSDGLNHADARFDDNWAETKANGILRGAYQFLRSNQDPIAQADLFLSKVPSLGPGDLPPVLDIESTDGRTPDQIVAGAKLWLDHVEAELGVRPIVYTGRYFWNNHMNGHPGLASYALWIPQWGPACPDVMEPWTEWQFFQSSATGTVPGIAGDVDIDVFNGDRATLEALVGGTATDACGSISAGGGIIDDADDCFESGGKSEFMRNEPSGYAGGLRWTYATNFDAVSNYGLWHLDLEAAGSYRVEVYTAAPHAQSRTADYQIAHGPVTDVVTADQTTVDGWQALGTFDFEAGAAQWIRVDDNTGEDYDGDRRQLAFDAVRLTRVTSGPPPSDDPPTDDPGSDDDSSAYPEPGAKTSGCRAAGTGSGPLWAMAFAVALIALSRRRTTHAR